MTDERCAQCQLPLDFVPDEPVIDVHVVCDNCDAVHDVGTAHLIICLLHMRQQVPAHQSRVLRAVYWRWN